MNECKENYELKQKHRYTHLYESKAERTPQVS